VWDDTGREYLDFTSGIAVSALGHCHPVWVEAIRRQAGELIHVSNLFRNPNQGELARRLVQQPGPGRVFFCNSGAEANEGLIKLARLHGMQEIRRRGQMLQDHLREERLSRPDVWRHERHAAGKIQKGFRPLVPGFAFGELNNLQSFADLIDDGPARSLSRPSRARAGSIRARRVSLGPAPAVRPAQPAAHARRGAVRHRPHRTLLRLRAFRHAPDAIGMAKGLGGGYPIGAIWAAEKRTPSCSARARTARRLAARRWPARRRWPCST
jgi:acetylornithine/N-succinyldiaminopimelate aminotransferase